MGPQFGKVDEVHVSKWKLNIMHVDGARGSLVVKAQCYKPEGPVFQTRWGVLIFFRFT
jgi:hypothetical protein